MNEQSFIIKELEHNAVVFNTMLSGINEDMIYWRQQPEKWNLLEIVCHLYDEERYDFKARINHVFTQPDTPMTPIDPPAWVKAHDYAGQRFGNILSLFLQERKASVIWLSSLPDTGWQQFYQHPKLGKMSAAMLLANWLAHDLLHIRQITAIRYHYLKTHTNEQIDYAGNW